MNADTFQRASAIFLEARRRTDLDRQDYIRTQCGTDDQLHQAVQILLNNDASPDAGLHTNAVGHAIGQAAAEVFEKLAPSDSNDRSAGRRIGRYLLIRKIGEGGMGAVYEAQQDNPNRIVALKIIRPGFASPATLRRFQHEVQVLGRLQHPGIAHIHEAGMDDTGDGAQPFFAMEFVNGPPLNTYVEMHHLGTRQRLELLARICDSVEHAHQKGVIHRDLKPSNILIVDQGIENSDHHRSSSGSDSFHSQPKILDFGVARAINSDVHATTLRTDVGQLIGTVSYMSPEQAAADPDQLDTRSDVYSLGVICYELLAGRLPYDLAKRPIPEAMRIIGQEDPTRLSMVNRVFRGDVETIVAKAMEKEKSRRYQSAAEFAADIRRYLRDEPIVARPASAAYQLRKFARRNKILAAGVAAVFAALVLGVIGTGLGLLHSREEARKAQKMNEYLKGMIGWFHPSESRGQDVALRDVLDEAARRIETDLPDEPEIAAALHDTIGFAYVTIGDQAAARSHLNSALAIRQHVFGDASQPVAQSLDHLAQSYFQTADWPQAKSMLEQSLAIQRQHRGKNVTELADVLSRLADVNLKLHDMAAAEKYIRESLQTRRTVLPHDDISVAMDLNKLGELLLFAQRIDEAEATLNEALQLRRTLHADKDLDTAGLLSQLAELSFQFKQDAVASEALFRQSLEILSNKLGPNHPQIIPTLTSLALLAQSRGDTEEIVRLYQRAVDIGRANAMLDQPQCIGSMGHLGASLYKLQRFDHAIPILQEALEIRRRVLPDGRASIARMEAMLAACLMHVARYTEAEPMLIHALSEFESTAGAEDRQTINARHQLIELYDAWDKSDSSAHPRHKAVTSTTSPENQPPNKP